MADSVVCVFLPSFGLFFFCANEADSEWGTGSGKRGSCCGRRGARPSGWTSAGPRSDWSSPVRRTTRRSLSRLSGTGRRWSGPFATSSGSTTSGSSPSGGPWNCRAEPARAARKSWNFCESFDATTSTPPRRCATSGSRRRPPATPSGRPACVAAGAEPATATKTASPPTPSSTSSSATTSSTTLPRSIGETTRGGPSRGPPT
mmetsp:Transcript_30580/g.98559  ORF Transcript_30580/g.98559 Transcript_30580/m.98559 type:complete len:203 (-) Transcript_30580:57-665(-)